MITLSFEEDTHGKRTLSSIYEDGDDGFVILGDNYDAVFDATADKYREMSNAIDFDVVHDTVTWTWVGVVVLKPLTIPSN